MLSIPRHLPRLVDPRLGRVRNLLPEPRITHRHPHVAPAARQVAQQPLDRDAVMVHRRRIAAREPVQRDVGQQQLAMLWGGSRVEYGAVGPRHHLLPDPRQQANGVAADNEAGRRRARAVQLDEGRAAREEGLRPREGGDLVGRIDACPSGALCQRYCQKGGGKKKNLHVSFNISPFWRRNPQHIHMHEPTGVVELGHDRRGCPAEVASLDDVAAPEAQGAHQLRDEAGIVDVGEVAIERRRRGEAVADKVGDDEMVWQISRHAVPRAHVLQKRQELDDRAGPAVEQQDGDGRGVGGEEREEVDRVGTVVVIMGDGDLELGECVQRRLPFAPGVAGLPVGDEVEERIARDAKVAVVVRILKVGGRDVGEPEERHEVLDVRVGNADGKRGKVCGRVDQVWWCAEGEGLGCHCDLLVQYD